MTFSANFNSIELPYLMKKVMDTVTKTNFLAGYMLSNAKPWRGLTLDKSIQTSAPTTGGSFAGLDPFATNVSNTKIRASFDLRGYYQAMPLVGLERDVNQADPNAAADYVADILEEGANAMSQNIGTLMYSDGTGNGNKDFLGLKAAIDSGTTVQTYGGIDRNVYTSFASLKTTVGAALTSLSPIITAINATEAFSNTLGNKVIITTRALFSALEALAQPGVRFDAKSDGFDIVTRTGQNIDNKSGNVANFGFNALWVRGIPIVSDEKCTANYMYVINKEYLNWYGIETAPEGYRNIPFGKQSAVEGADGESDMKGVGAIFSDFIKVPNQYGQVGYIILRGNLVTFNPNRHAVVIFS